MLYYIILLYCNIIYYNKYMCTLKIIGRKQIYTKDCYNKSARTPVDLGVTCSRSSRGARMLSYIKIYEPVESMHTCFQPPSFHRAQRFILSFILSLWTHTEATSTCSAVQVNDGNDRTGGLSAQPCVENNSKRGGQGQRVYQQNRMHPDHRSLFRHFAFVCKS